MTDTAGAVEINTDLIIDWVSALRSGEYQQASGRLRTPQGWCCLGVLTDLAIKKGLIDAEWHEDPTQGYSAWSVLWRDHGLRHYIGQTLPDDLDKMVGLADDCGALRNESWEMPDPYPYPKSSEGSTRKFGSLAAANDDSVSFTTIADSIEARLLRGEAGQAHVVVEIGGSL